MPQQHRVTPWPSLLPRPPPPPHSGLMNILAAVRARLGHRSSAAPPADSPSGAPTSADLNRQWHRIGPRPVEVTNPGARAGRTRASPGSRAAASVVRRYRRRKPPRRQATSAGQPPLPPVTAWCTAPWRTHLPLKLASDVTTGDAGPPARGQSTRRSSASARRPIPRASRARWISLTMRTSRAAGSTPRPSRDR